MVISKESLNEQIKSFNARCRVLGIINDIYHCSNGIKLHEGIDTIGGSAFQCY